jgi:hypothetical protein
LQVPFDIVSDCTFKQRRLFFSCMLYEDINDL